MSKKFLFLIVLAVVAIGFVMMRGGTSDPTSTEESTINPGDPLDTVTEFYNEWFKAATATDTDPYTLGLATDARLAAGVQDYLQSTDQEAEKDPVLCLTEMPPRVGAKEVFKVDDKAQYMVLARGVGGVTPDRAIVDLEVVDDAWRITKIECTSGESAPDREFAFERVGNLLKHDEPPLDPDTWYVVFEENGEPGHIAPLFFNESSICITVDGSETVCNPDTFTNAGAATVKGEMTEAGVEVKRIEF